MASSKAIDIGSLLDEGAWSGTGRALVFLTAMVLVIDGFDNQALGFALPAILREWGVSRAAFAPVVALGLIGMTLGAGFGGLMGDRIGRKRALLASVVLFGLMTLAIAFARDISQIGLLRLLAGVGVGGALPNATALAAEFTPRKSRPFAVTAAIVCVPLGGMVGGIAAGLLLPTFGWRSLFVLGGVAPLLAAIVLQFLLAESPRFLVRRPARAAELARLMKRLGHPAPENVELVDAVDPSEPKGGFRALLAPAYLRDTLALWGAFFFCLFAIYSVFSWAPTVLSANGLSLAEASNATAVYNFGGVIGALACAWLIAKVGSRIAMVSLSLMGAASAFILIFQPVEGGWSSLVVWLGLNGFFVNAVQTTAYALAAFIYVSSIRSTGAGGALGVGRLGAILSSISGPLALGGGPPRFFLLIGFAMILNAGCLALIRRHIPKS